MIILIMWMNLNNNRVLRKRRYPAGTPGFGDLPPSNFKFPPQIDGSRILNFRDLGYIRDISVCANTLMNVRWLYELEWCIWFKARMLVSRVVEEMEKRDQCPSMLSRYATVPYSDWRYWEWIKWGSVKQNIECDIWRDQIKNVDWTQTKQS